jgi:hypothetical protein
MNQYIYVSFFLPESVNVDDKTVFRGLLVNRKAFCRLYDVKYTRSPMFCVHAINEYAVLSVNVNKQCRCL